MKSPLVACSLLLMTGFVQGAEAPNAGDARLREKLRDLTNQLAAAQGDLGGTQAQATAAAAERDAALSKVKELQQQFASAGQASDKTIKTLSAQVAAQASDLEKHKEALRGALAEGERLAKLLRELDTQKQALLQERGELQGKLADRERKNAALFMLSNEILTRYENYSLGKVLAAKEPFIGSARTKAEMLIQGYEDRINDNLVRE